MNDQGVAFVLVRPQRGANVGAACRAIKNMGFRDLRLVQPGLDRADPATRNPAWGAWDVLDGARETHDLLDAVGDCTAVVACSGRVDADPWTPRQLAALAPALTAGGRLAVVFGPEASGLTRAELGLCPRHVRIPTAPEQPSLNLAQAVLLVAYELRLAAGAPAEPPARAVAAVSGLEAALADLREGLLAIGYLPRANPGAILAEIRALLARAQPDEREITLLRGLARQVRWAGDRIAARVPGGDNPGPPEEKR